jgi:hypothetical protein
MAGAREEQVAGCDLNDAPQVHYRDPVADVLHDAEVVGDKQVGQAKLALQIDEQIEDLRLHGDVEGRDGLVANNQLGPHRERPGDADALPLPARKLVGEVLGLVGA